jgi:hypothetical protein
MNEEITIQSIDPTTFELYDYKTSDTQLIAKSELDTVFSSSTDYIEFYIYDENQNQIYPQNTTIPLTSYKVKNGDVLLNPQSDLENLGFDIGTYSIVYEFYRKRLSSNINETYFIKEISSDRTEIRLDSNIINNISIVSSSNEFIEYRNNAEFFVDFYLNFGSNTTIIANNIALDNENPEDPTVLIKLYEPLPENLGLKDQLWVVEQLSKSQAYQVNFPFIPIIEDDFIYVAGPNFNLDVKQEIGNSSQAFSYNTLINSNITSSVNQIQNLLKEKEININVNYEDFSNFIHFSTALTRLENFYYKVGLIENYTNDIVTLNTITGDTTNTIAYSSSISTLTSKIDSIIQNFDGYEYFMYFNSGSNFSYPKTNSTPPFSLASTGSVEVLNWIGSADESNAYYGGVALSASNFDESNLDRLYNTIPEYLKEDPNNIKYELFIDMVAQHYDNIWLYTKDITNKFNADNRLEYGISKDLVADAIKDFGVKLYTNGFNNTDLYSAFLGITPSGSLFPFPDITGSLPAPSGYEYVDTQISASNNVIPLNDVNKRLYKRIYHNIPYLLKTKGTIAGLRALITSYGIPDTILRINEFGGKDRNESQDWDLKQNVFNYAFDTGVNATNYVSSSFISNTNFGGETPQTIQFRFKSAGIPSPVNNVVSPNIRYSQSLFSTDDGGALVLEYTGSGLVSSSYSGSSIDPYDTWGTIKWIPAHNDDSTLSASVYLPLFNEDWWSVQISFTDDFLTSSLYVANELEGNLGFTGSSTIIGFDSSFYTQASKAFLNKDSNVTTDTLKVYTPFSGSYQELRYFNTSISQNAFYDFVLNPYSIEGSGVNTSPNELFFRADLGTTLNIDSRTSIHPKVTGSLSQITQSFSSDSSFTINNAEWVSNVEYIYQDQTPSGIKNRVTDKIALIANNIAENPYGFESGSSIATISSQNSLSPFRSIEQESFINSSYTPDVNYLEVAISPQSQINDDINAQLGYFNIGDYIGDPRHMSSDNRSYPALDTLRDAYFEKYIQSYDVVDFIRLIKFFDNSLFKMIKDFTPARTSLASGVVVKQHLLERNRQRPAQTSWENVTYSGSIKPQSRNYNTGSGDVGQYEANGGSSIYRFTGGTGGSFERYNGLETSPSASAYGLYNRFNLTQSYNESIEGSIANTIDNAGAFVGYRDIEIFDQSEFYDGEFSGSNITVTTQSLNPGCDPYLKVTDKPIFFNPIIFSLTDGTNFQGTTTENEIQLNLNFPKSGDAWIVSEQIAIGSPFSKVKYIKLSNTDASGTIIKNYLDNSPSIKWITPDANVRKGSNVAEYIIEGVTTFANSTLLRISQTQGDNTITFIENPGGGGGTTYYPITSSINAGSENWSLTTSGNFTSSNALGQEEDNEQQGNFINSSADKQTQYFYFWNGGVSDEQSFFNTGSDDTPIEEILSDPSKFSFGSYNPKRTSNIPWFFSASINYSASDLGTGTSITASGTYHSASKYTGATLTNQNFTLDRYTSYSGVFKPSPLITQNLSTAVFKTTYNNQIPGDSGSLAGLIGGHPKIKIPGTASMDFYFPSLTIGGTQRALTPPSPEFTPLSGSDLIPGVYPTGNKDFFMTPFFRPFIINWSSSISPNNNDGVSQDGAIEISYDNLESEFGEDPGSLDEILIKYNLFISASVSNYTASIQTRAYGDTEGSDWAVDTDIYRANINREINIVSGQIQEGRRDPGNTVHYMAFRIVLESPEPNFEYYISTFNGFLSSSFNGQQSRFPGSGNAFNSTAFHGSLAEPQQFTSSFFGIPDTYPEVDIQVNLKVTGSSTATGGDIITSSNPLTNQEIFGGKTFIFPDSPILGTTPRSNNEDDIYFIEYSMSNYDYKGSTSNNFFDVSFLESGDTGSKIFITQSAESAGASEYDLTGSLLISRGNFDSPTQIGSNILSQQFIVPNSASVGNVSLTGSFEYPFEYDDAFRMGVEVTKSFGAGLTITAYTMSIFPSSSIYAPITPPPSYSNYKIPTSSGFIIPSYFGEGILPFNLALDCQPLLNNYNDTRQNSHIMDVSFNNITGSILPVNFFQILNNTAIKASIPDSNYTSIRSIKSRYLGTKTTSMDYNIWSIRDEDTFGKNPVIELKDAYFGYFKSIKDLYPLVNDKISLDLTYLLDQQSNAIPPSLEGTGIDILEKTFPTNNPISIGFISSSTYAQELDDSYPIYKLTVKPTPILYTQTSSAGYASEIPLTGSGRISMYDNSDADSFIDYSFTAQGTSSWANAHPTPEAGGSYIQVLNPTEQIVTNPYNAGFYVNPYATNNGILTFGPSGSNTVATNQQRISAETSFATSFLNESGGVELAFDIQMLSGSTPVEFTLEDISLKVYRAGKEPFNAGSIVGTGIDNLLRFVSNNVNRGLFRNKNIFKTDTIGAYNTQRGSYYALIENLPLNTFLSQKGVYIAGKGGILFQGDITGLEFIIKANSGEFLISDNDQIKFQLRIEIQNPKKERFGANLLFPTEYDGPIFPVKISTIGERTTLLAGDNTGSAPFWVYSGSGNNNILVMSSSNINEAYGGNFYQGPIPYVPGPSEYFDSGTEPSGTQFPKITSPIEFFPGDEIRFGNNENYTYTIQSITSPQNNIEGGKGKIKIVLDSEVPESINKDFFLIRRYVPKASSFIINAPFPYSAESSGSEANGIILPTYPTEYIKNSGSLIVTDLISKGVIK